LRRAASSGALHAQDDDDLSRSGGSLSHSSRSFSSGFHVDWDEIDSIAEESLSVASSCSSGHRKRKSSRRRTHTSSNPIISSSIDVLENSRSRYNQGGVSGVAGGCSRSSSSRSRSDPHHQSSKHHQRQKQKRQSSTRRVGIQDIKGLKRLAVMGIIILSAVLSIHYCGVILSNVVDYKPSVFSGMGADRLARRALSRSTNTYLSRQWPASVRDEQNNSFELILHPISDDVSLSVPRFFLSNEDDGSMETLGKTCLTRALTDMIGRTTIGGSSDFSVRTIYVGIPSLNDDWHCRQTVESIFRRSKYPERVRVGVVDQFNFDKAQSCDLPLKSCSKEPSQALCQYRSQIDVYEMESDLAVGPTYARHLVDRLYRGEYYVLRINSHTTFTKHWDVEIIEQFEGTGNEMAILTTYLDEAKDNLNEKTGISEKESRKVLCNAAYEGSGHDRYLRYASSEQPDLLPAITEMPQLQPYFASQFSFARGHLVLTVPHDPNVPLIPTEDEDISMEIRAFTHGYDFYTPQQNVCFDNSSEQSKDEIPKKKRTNSDTNARIIKSSLERLYGILGMTAGEQVIEDNMFGIGSVRTVKQFNNAFGIHPGERITERNLCNYVSTGRMHKQFHNEHLKKDGMGINYDSIHYRFNELQNNHESGR